MRFLFQKRRRGESHFYDSLCFSDNISPQCYSFLDPDYKALLQSLKVRSSLKYILPFFWR